MMKLFYWLLAAITVLPVWADIELFTNGAVQGVIVLPEKPLEAERYAAQELQYHLEKATGATFAICPENEVPQAKHRIYIGNTKAAGAAGIDVSVLAPSGYVVRTAGNDLYLAGRDRFRLKVGAYWGADWQGSLFAVYDFLENELGVKWLWPGKLGEVIPSATEIRIGKLDRQGQPFFRYSQMSIAGRNPDWVQGFSSRASQDAFYEDQRIFLLRHRVSSQENMAYGHAFEKYWERFGKDHPEYFNMLPNGKREPLPEDDGKRISLCVSQPELWTQIIRDWQGQKSRNPENIPYRPYVNACENDSPGLCVCGTCRSWDYPDPKFEDSKYWNLKNRYVPTRPYRFVNIARCDWGEGAEPTVGEPVSVSDRYARFYVELLKKAREVDPSAKVIGYAYANYRQPPRRQQLADGVIINFVPAMFYPYTERHSREFQEEWLGWRKQGTREMLYRPNYLLAGANMPISLAEQISRDFGYAAANGAVACEFDSLNGAWSTQGPTLYLLMRMQWNPKLSYGEIMDEYYSGFGKASAQVRTYFEFWKKHSDSVDQATFRKYGNEERNANGGVGGTFINFVLVSARLFPQAKFTEGYRLLDAAKAAAAGDASALERVEFLRKGLVDAELTTQVRIAQRAMTDNTTPATRKAFDDVFRKLSEYRKSVERDNVCNYTHMARWESSGAQWPWPCIKD